MAKYLNKDLQKTSYILLKLMHLISCSKIYSVPRFEAQKIATHFSPFYDNRDFFKKLAIYFGELFIILAILLLNIF